MDFTCARHHIYSTETGNIQRHSWLDMFQVVNYSQQGQKTSCSPAVLRTSVLHLNNIWSVVFSLIDGVEYRSQSQFVMGLGSAEMIIFSTCIQLMKALQNS